MRAAPAFLIVVGLVACAHLAREGENLWQIGGWAGLGWFVLVVANAAYVGAIAGAMIRGH